MRRGLLPMIAVLTAVAGTSAQATTYCLSNATTVQDGATVTISWDMTSSQARRILHPSQRAPTTHCTSSWHSLGGFYRPIEIIEKPRLNTATSRRYAVSYRALNSGHDHMVIKVYWITRSNQTQSATVIYDINVVDREL